MLRHIVTWKLTGESPAEVDEQVDRIARELEALGPLVPEIDSIRVVRNVLKHGHNFDGAVIVDVADEAALEAYMQHPAHVEAAGYIKSVTAERAAIDFEV